MSKSLRAIRASSATFGPGRPIHGCVSLPVAFAYVALSVGLFLYALAANPHTPALVALLVALAAGSVGVGLAIGRPGAVLLVAVAWSAIAILDIGWAAAASQPSDQHEPVLVSMAIIFGAPWFLVAQAALVLLGVALGRLARTGDPDSCG